MNFLKIGSDKIINLDDIAVVDRVTHTAVVNANPTQVDATILRYATGGTVVSHEYTGEVGDQLWFYLTQPAVSKPYDVPKMPPRIPDSIITQPVLDIPVGGTVEFTASGVFQGTAADITEKVTWTSTAPNVASVSAKGVATGLVAGPTNIVATLGTVQQAAPLTVTPAVAPPPPPPLLKPLPGNPPLPPHPAPPK